MSLLKMALLGTPDAEVRKLAADHFWVCPMPSLEAGTAVMLRTRPCFLHTRWNYNCWWRSGFELLCDAADQHCHVVDHNGYPVVTDMSHKYKYLWGMWGM